MALFNRKKKESVLPEIDQYYEGERRDRAGIAWLLAIISVVIVALFIAALFFVGRWAYREVVDSNTNDALVTNEDDPQNLPNFDGGENSSQGSEEDQVSQGDEEQISNQGDQAQQHPEQEIESEGRVDAPARTETPSDPSSAQGTPIPSTVDDAPLPHTGPENTLTLFVTVLVIASSIHYFVSAKKNNR